MRVVARELGISLKEGDSLARSAHVVLADMTGGGLSVSTEDHEDHIGERLTHQRSPPALTRAPAALAGRKRWEPLIVGAEGNREVSQSPGSSSEQGGVTNSQERIHLRLARLQAEEDVRKSMESGERKVEMRILEEHLRLKSWKKRQRR